MGIGTVSEANIGACFKRRVRACMSFPEHLDTILNCTELDSDWAGPCSGCGADFAETHAYSGDGDQ